MAERIEQFEVPPPRTEQSAPEELAALLETLHEHGLLRFANDVVAAQDDVARVVVSGLNQKGTLDALQNLSTLLMALSRVPPAQFYRVVFALKDACLAVAEHSSSADGDEAPGLRGAYKLLNDDALWHALAPLIDGLKRFAAGLDREVDKPISAFSGKPSNA
jgi:uncharacterized protein YjgD (DUF1641 family)